MHPHPWAKLRRSCREGRGTSCRSRCACDVDGQLSVIGHGADVAAVMKALLGQPAITRGLASLLERSALSGDDIDRLVALTALHDLGRPAFFRDRK